ncbi:non-hydrolyzing UDP-N-acetylglucosamine 2-epimerase [Dietzia sp. WMMA184]|uniref:non-hydrolyzing UDP-N-acetylglucosamine 2-epimerase n=1 Tax=Dietzia sp. WMMA184 TaxID=2039808 RepID=UPI002738AB92|nr:UDP-N-acetylglucosamine 2-epimerase (non-hydrolyzing) [Dietzia sp. WMMA184]
MEPTGGEAEFAMSKKRIMIVYGTRPEAIKVAPVIATLENHPALDPLPVVTGQHREMLDQVNTVFGISPVSDLDVLKQEQTLNGLAARLFAELEPVYRDLTPDAVVVQGDTTTVLAAALAAFYERIPVVHIEAGLRSHNLMSPFPEEANRKLVSQVTSLHLAPTMTSKDNLLNEGVDPEKVVVTGNTVIDALFHTVRQDVEWTDSALADAIAEGRRILVVTTHRRENWGGAMEGVGRALRTLAQRYPNDVIVLPAHRNPIVRQAILPALSGLENVITLEPLAYPEFTKLLEAAHIVLTDSGGVQEEAPSLGKPVLVMRENTERPEGVVAGTVKLIGTDEDRIVSEVSVLKEEEDAYFAMARAANPYGDGRAAERSVAAIAHMFGLGPQMPDFVPGSPGS